MNAFHNKLLPYFFTSMLMLSASQAYGFHVGLDVIDVDIAGEIDRINDEIEQSFRSFWGPSSGPAPAPAKTKDQQPVSTNEQFWQQTRSQVRSLAKELDTTAERMGADKEQTRFPSPRSFFSSLKSNSKHVLQELKQAENKIKKVRADISSRLKKAETAQSFDVKEEVVKDTLNITINLPGFKEEEIKVTLEENRGAKHKKLLVKATKQETSAKHDKQATSWHSQSFTSMRYINGRQMNLEYTDGKLTVSVDLPENIKDQEYTMKLEKDALVVSFPTTSAPAQGTRQLHFDGKKASTNNEAKEAFSSWK